MEAPILVIKSEKEAIDLILTQSDVMMCLSSKLMKEFERDAEKEADLVRKDAGGKLSRFIVSNIEKLFRKSINYRLEDIISIAHDGEQLIFSYSKKHSLSFEQIREDHKPALATFSDEDSMAFISAFNSQKELKSQVD